MCGLADKIMPASKIMPALFLQKQISGRHAELLMGLVQMVSVKMARVLMVLVITILVLTG